MGLTRVVASPQMASRVPQTIFISQMRVDRESTVCL